MSYKHHSCWRWETHLDGNRRIHRISMDFQSPYSPHTVQWWHPRHPLLHRRSHATPLVASLPMLAAAEDVPPSGSRQLPSPLGIGKIGKRSMLSIITGRNGTTFANSLAWVMMSHDELCYSDNTHPIPGCFHGDPLHILPSKLKFSRPPAHPFHWRGARLRCVGKT